MATVKEAWVNRNEVIDESVEITYYVIGAADEDEVRTVCEADIAETYDGMPKRRTRITARLSEDTWAVIAYFTKDPWTWPDTRLSFDTTGGTEHINCSREVVSFWGPKGTANRENAIGVSNGHVKGIDIPVPIFKWSETHYFSDASITDEYKAILRNLTGRVNNDSFKGFDAGEVLFFGVSGTRNGDDSDDLWELTFNFASDEPESDITVGTITGISRPAWHYMDIEYESTADIPTSQLLPKAIAVYIHRLYKAKDFSDLGIGT